MKSLEKVNKQHIKESDHTKTKGFNNCKKVFLVAICFMFVVIVINFYQDGLFGSKTDIFTLETGETIRFVEGTVSESIIDEDITIKELTSEEFEVAFSDLNVTGQGYFNATNGNIIGLEGEIDNVKFIISKQNTNFYDIEIKGEEYNSIVEGVSILAGYFITDANSQGEKTAIYYATFNIGENTFHVEHSGMANEHEKIKSDLIKVICQLIENGQIDLEQIIK